MTAEVLPPKVRNYFDRMFVERSQPFCIELSSDFSVRQYWGDGAVYGFSDISSGEDWSSNAPFLGNRLVRGTEVIPYVHCANDVAAHVHIVAEDNSVYLLYLDATQDMERRRHDQQLSNEARFLNHRQSQIVEDLIEATAELDTRRREAEDADRIKGRFIASMTHEFRTPITAVLGYTGLLAEKCDTDPELAAHVDSVRRAANHLLKLTDNILDQARLERGTVDVNEETVGMHSMLADVSAIFAPLAAEKGLAFGAFLEDRVPEHVVTDPLRLRQILVNLIGNAIKFTGVGEVTLKLDYADSALVAIVADSGPGIAEGDQQRIFRAFERVRRNETRPGAGLGLSITMRLVELLGGSLELDSSPGRGSRFTVRIPVLAAKSPAIKETTPLPAMVVAGNGGVLVAEDNPDIGRLLEIYFKRAGIPLVLVGDGQAALDHARANPPDVVVLDINMPVMNGLDAARALRASGYPGPLLALTASRSDEDRQKAIDAGFTEFLNKPVDFPALIDRLGQMLKRGAADE